MTLPPFALLVEAHGDELLGHARRLTGPEAAEDVLQDALLRALRAYPRLEHGRQLRAWLYRVTTTAAMDHHRRRRPEVPTAEPPAAAAGDPAATDGFEEIIAPLTAVSRETLRLRFVEDLDYAGIAARLDVTPEAARQRVSSSLRSLRARLEALT